MQFDPTRKYRVKEIAAAFDLSPATIYRAVESGALRAERHGTGKGAIRIFTKVTAAQHAKDRIRCNSIHPGPVDTEMFHSAFPDRAEMERRLRRIPLGRMGTVAEIVAAVLYFASDDSAYTSGSELLIDGGAMAQ